MKLTRKDYIHKVSAFVKKYKDSKTQDQFENLVTLTRVNCEKLLEHIPIKGVVQGRKKKYESLKKKLKLPDGNYDDADDEVDADEADLDFEEAHADIYDENGEVPNLRDWIYKGGNIYKHPDMGDLAGIRIGLYFPDDIKKVAQEIEKHFRMKHCWGTVTGGRIATQGRNLDVQEHLTGAWVSPGTDDHWEHYGYKSWQVVVQWKEDLLEPFTSEDLRGRLGSLRKKMPKGFKSLRVEIQVGTVVTQAWAEVQHNIIYKNPDNILTTPNMKRVIDAVNGLAITTDIMLKELGQALDVAKKEAEKEAEKRARVVRERFDWAISNLGWLKEDYMSQMRQEGAQLWVSSLHEADKMLNTMLQATDGQHADPTPPLNATDVERLREQVISLRDTAQVYGVDKAHRIVRELFIDKTSDPDFYGSE